MYPLTMPPDGDAPEAAPFQLSTRRGQATGAPPPKENNIPRKKRQYSPDERAEVAETRKRGACEKCRKGKVKCTHSKPPEAQKMEPPEEILLRPPNLGFGNSFSSAGSEVSSRVTSGSGSTVSDISLQTESATSEPQGFHSRFISADQPECLVSGSDPYEEYLSNQVEMGNGIAASEFRSDASRNFEFNPTRGKLQDLQSDMGMHSQQSTTTSSHFQHKSSQALPERWSNNYGQLGVGSAISTEAHQSDALMQQTQMATQNGMDASKALVRRAHHQQRHSQASQDLHHASQDQYQQVLVATRRNCGLPHATGSQTSWNMYQDSSPEIFSNSQRGKTPHQSTMPVSDPVVDTTHPTVLGWVQQQQPGIDPNQGYNYTSSRNFQSQQQRASTSKGDFKSFPSDSFPNMRQMSTFSEPFPRHPAAAPSIFQPTSRSYSSLPRTVSSMGPSTSSAQFSAPSSPRIMINEDAERRERLRARQNIPRTPQQQTRFHGQQSIAIHAPNGSRYQTQPGSE